ncbi:MAG TPA: sugar transferase [Gaiellaceae bacterium]|nr:sugar transferase [Gaiellaceae bacterium]
MSSKAAPPAEPASSSQAASASRPAPPARADVRASRVYLLSRGPLLGLARRCLSVACLVTLDVVGLALGIYAALVVRELLFGEGDILWGLLWREGPADWLKFAAPITVLVFAQAGLYRPRERRPGAGRVLACLIVVALIVLAFGFGTGYDFGTTGLIPTSVVTSAVLIGLLRAAYGSVALELMRAAGMRRRVVLVGEPEGIARLRRALAAARGGLAYELLGVVSAADVPGLRRLGARAELPHVLERTQPDEVILTEAGLDERAVLDVVEQAHRQGVKVRLVPDTTELLVRRGEYVPGQGVPLFELRPPVLTGWDWAVKRTFDYTVSVLVGGLFLPLWLLVALAIKLDSRGPVLYVDRRVGVGEREFGMLKFRTMVEGAAELQPALEPANEAGGALFKIRDDPRVTRAGRVLRRLSLDEIPQLVNVLKGEMSLVGPRPLPLRDHALLEDWHKARYAVLPGMTGLWQISGRSGLTFDDLVRLDFTYLENWSIWLDITILARTIPAVISRRGAY